MHDLRLTTARRAHRRRPAPPTSVTAQRRCARYLSSDGRARELVELRLHDGSRLVVDRCPCGRSAPRLLARLDRAEPAANADLVCAQYVADRRRERPVLARAVRAADFKASASPVVPQLDLSRALRDEAGIEHRLEVVRGRGTTIPELRWRCRRGGCAPRTESLRDVVAAVQSYEPAHGMSRAAVRRHEHDRGLSVCALRAEIERLQASRIVLNRALRERVLAAVAAGEVSMSEVAMRCGRVKRDHNGNASGETSWLARRLGLLPDGGCSRPTPWIHSEVLALIARVGLGVPPHEVEL